MPIDPISTRISKSTNVGMVQVNNSFSEQSYLPLSIGFLTSYANAHVENIDDFNFLLPVYKRISVDAAVKQMEGVDLVAFSVYVWNYRISCFIAERLKQENPDVIILFGGCHVPDIGLEDFMRNLPFVDLACTGEGEVAFASVLSNFHSRNWTPVPSLAYFDECGKFIRNPSAPRIEDLNDIPSPYLTGIFEPLIKAHPEEHWIGLWETNRGCPFKCTFCDWGVGSKKRMADYDLDRLFQEIDWFSKIGVQFVYCCDANFGMYKDRDLAITQKFVENKKLYGYPEAFSVQNTKNSTEASYNIQKLMTQSGLSKGVLLAFQSLHQPSLKAVKRANIKLETFYDLQHRFTAEGVETFSDIILGLPEETYDTFTDGVSTLISVGQHNRIQFNNLSILPNAEMGELAYQKEYELELVETKMINIHGSLGEWVDDIYETQQLVVSTSTMSREDWARCRSFAFMTALVHFDKLLQIPCIIMNVDYGVEYKDLINSMMESDTPALSRIINFFTDKSRDIQGGGAEYCESEEWLNIWWPADEYMFIKLVKENLLDEFYNEALKVFGEIADVDMDLLTEAVFFNKQLIKVPFVNTDVTVELSYNIWDVYRGNLIGKCISTKKGNYRYKIDRSTSTWSSWDEWYKQVVWYCNKKGNYLYKCVLENKEEDILHETCS